MSIPDDDTIQRELLVLIASRPERRVLASAAYDELAYLHPELTSEELTQRYRNSVSKWANRVQFARLHLANRGLLYRANTGLNAGHGYWVITPKGEEKVKALSPSGPSIEEQVAADLGSLILEEELTEGGKTARLVAFYERSPELRAAAIKLHGTTCKACGFNFARAYGERGKDYIEVHHLVPISTHIEPKTISAEKDLIVLCSNCHRMVHRKKDKPLSLGELIEIVRAHALHQPTEAEPTIQAERP